MDFYLIRHADALPVGEPGVSSDDARPLSSQGHAQARELGEAFRRRGVRLERVLVSPLVRAQETAEELVRAWAPQAPELVRSEHLAPGTKRRRLARFVRRLNAGVVGLVGHQPDLGVFAAWLVGSKKARIELPKAGFAHVACHAKPDKGAGTLLALLGPDWYASAAGTP
jgi:phosphohistidine phosphatase